MNELTSIHIRLHDHAIGRILSVIRAETKALPLYDRMTLEANALGCVLACLAHEKTIEHRAILIEAFNSNYGEELKRLAAGYSFVTANPEGRA